MARPVLFAVVALAFVVATTYLLAKYVYPAYLEYRRDVTLAEMELEKRRLERDEKLVEAAEEERGPPGGSGDRAPGDDDPPEDGTVESELGVDDDGHRSTDDR